MLQNSAVSTPITMNWSMTKWFKLIYYYKPLQSLFICLTAVNRYSDNTCHNVNLFL